MSRTPVNVPDELFGRLRRHLDDGQLVELTHHIALENMRGRFQDAAASGLTDRRSAAHTALLTVSASRDTARPRITHSGRQQRRRLKGR